MNVMEPPECPVCLVSYDAVTTVPRVLSCGHSTCEACISQLLTPFPNATRCPSCIQLVKLPSSPSFLPKNIDLLRFSSSFLSHTRAPEEVISRKPQLSPLLAQNSAVDMPFIPNLWSSDFYLKWKHWVLPRDVIVIESDSQNDGFLSPCYGKIQKTFKDSIYGFVLKEDRKLGLVKIGVFMNGSGKEKEASLSNDSSKFTYSYEAKIMKVLYLMQGSERDELYSVLNASFRVNRLGKVYGFWCNDEDDSVYIAFERLGGGLVKAVGTLENGFSGKIEDQGESFSKLSDFGMIGMEMCEVLNDLHLEGFVLGCLAVSCFAFNQFGRVFIDFGEVLATGRRTCRITAIDDLEVMLLDNLDLQNCLFVSPELFLELLKEGNKLGDGNLKYHVGYESDIWSLACFLISLLVDKSFVDEMRDYCLKFFTALSDQNGIDYVDLYTDWKERIVALLECMLGPKFSSLKHILSKCLNFDPASRPAIAEIWKCIRRLVVKQEFHLSFHQEKELVMEYPGNSLVLGNLCHLMTETERGNTRKMGGGLLQNDENDLKNVDQVEELMGKGHVVHSVSNGNVRCIDLKGHFDCVTGLAVGGGFLFSCSHDKVVNVWSLQDFSLIHSFKGHEDRVTAVVFVDGGESLCISADKGGVICIWGARHPLVPAPRKKLLEPKDWRYSGIHALAVSGTQYLYTGSGDKSVKAWSLQDYTLICTMTGHKSVVSSLSISSGVLYSGSWDGTIRLWSLSDHNPLAVLGEDIPGNLSSVLSLAAEDSMLFVAHEDGSIKIWHNNVLLKSREVHNGAIFSICKMGKWLFTGGWDKTINVQEVYGNAAQVDAMLTGFISGDSVVTTLIYWEGKLFVGQADRVVKVYSGV